MGCKIWPLRIPYQVVYHTNVKKKIYIYFTNNVFFYDWSIYNPTNQGRNHGIDIGGVQM